MTARFICGAEGENTYAEAVVLGANASFDTTQKRTGSWAFKSAFTVAAAIANIRPRDGVLPGLPLAPSYFAGDVIWTTFGEYLSAWPAASTVIGYNPLLVFGSYLAGDPYYFRKQADGKVSLIAYDGSVLATSTQTLATASWYSVKVSVDITDKRVKYIVDGTTWINWQKGSAFSGSFYGFEYGGIAPSKQNPNCSLWTDDIWWNDNRETKASTEPPDTAIAVRVGRPDGDVAAADEWEASGGGGSGTGTYTEWDEALRDDADYNQTADSATTDKVQRSTVQSAATVGIPSGDYIWAVSLMGRAEDVVAGQGIIPQLAQGADVVDGPVGTLSVGAYNVYYAIYAAAPPGGFITRSAFDALEIGWARKGAVANHQPRVSMTYLYVATSPTAQPGQTIDPRRRWGQVV